MQLHTTTGVTAAGFLAPGISATAVSGHADSTGQLPPMGTRRNSLGALGAVPTTNGGGSGSGAPVVAATASTGTAQPNSSLGRMIGPVAMTGPATPRIQTGAVGPGPRSPAISSPGGGAGAAARGTNVSILSAGVGGGGFIAGGGTGGRPSSRTPAKDAAAVPRKVAAVDNIAEALGRFSQESMELAPKPPPRPPSSTSSDDGDLGPISSDDEATQEELDVLEKLYLVMPNLESPGKGAGGRTASPGHGILSQPPSRVSGSFTNTVGGSGSRPASPLQHITASFGAGGAPPGHVPPLAPAAPGTATAAAAALPAAGPAPGRSISPSPMPSSSVTAVAANAGSPTPLDAAVVAAKRKALARKGAAAPQQPTFLPSKAVLLFHQRALGITVPLANSTNGPGAAAGSGGGAVIGNGIVSGIGGGIGGYNGPAVAVATTGVSGPYGSLSQPPDAPVTNTYVNRDADYLMMRQMVEAALAAGQSRPATAGPAIAAASAAAAAAAAGRPLLPATPPARRGATGRGVSSAGNRKKSSKKSAKKIKLPPAPPTLVPRPAVPIYLQHLVRPGSASVGALMGNHQPAGIDAAIINAVLTGQAVDPVQGLSPPPGTVNTGNSTAGSPTRALSPVRPLSPVRLPQPSQATRSTGAKPGSESASRPASPVRPGRGPRAASGDDSAGGSAPGSNGGVTAANSGRSDSNSKPRSRNPSPPNRTNGGGGAALQPTRPLSSSNSPGFARHTSMHGSSGSRPYTAPGNGNWAANRLERLRGAAATKAAATASMSPLRASLAAPISGLKARRQAKPLTEVEFGVFNRTMDAALMPLTRAAAKLGTYGESLPPPNIYATLSTFSGGNKSPAAATAAAATSTPLPAVSGSASVHPSLGANADADGSRAPSTSRSSAMVAAAALASTSQAASGAGTLSPTPALPASDGSGPVSSVGTGPEEPARRKLKRRNLGGWDWPPGQGMSPAFDVLEETRHAMAAVLAGAEVDENGRTGPCDRVGEVGRLMRRFQKQETRTSFNLSHAVNGVDQIVALVDVLGHPDLAWVSELLLAGNALHDEAFTPLGARLASAECGALRRLDLGYNNLTAASVELLLPLMKDEVAAMSKAQRLRRGLDAGPLHGVLHRLILDGNPIGDAGAELLCDAASSDYTYLAELRLSRCGLGERGAAAAGRLLENSNAIKILDLSWNTLGKRGGQSIGEGLRNANSIQQLYVAWTGITDIGASHIAKALKGNTTLQVLDMSGDSVSGDTSLVLLDSLAENGALTQLVLRDNPVGVVAARKLLKALHQGVIESVDLLGCSFGGMGGSTVVWDPHDPDGVYDLDLETPAHYQVAVELVGLAAHMGLRSWRAVTLNGKPFRLNNTNQMQLPVRGRLHVEFVSCTPLVRDEGPLTDTEVRSMWFTIADPEGVRTPQGPMTLISPQEEEAAAQAGSSPGSPSRRGGKGGSAAAALPRKSPRGGPGSVSIKSLAAVAAAGRGGAGRGGVPGTTEISSATELKGATDEWKLQLLEALVTDVYLTCAQLKYILRCFDGRDMRTEAVVQAFGVLVDTENFWAVLNELEPSSREQVETRLGKVRMFFPENPTGRYTLMLSQLPHQCVAKQLLQQYIQQYDNKLTHHPNRVCFTACNMDGVPTDVSDPHKLYLPQEGILELCFVDLRLPPPGTRSLSRAQFAILISHLLNQEVLDPVGLTRIIDHPALPSAVGALRRWESWTRKHPVSASVPYMWKAAHEIRRRDDPETAAAMEAAAVAAALEAAQTVRRDTVGVAVAGGAAPSAGSPAQGEGTEPPATPSSGTRGTPRLPRESSSYAPPQTPNSTTAPDTPTRRFANGVRDGVLGPMDSPIQAGGDPPLSQRSQQGVRPSGRPRSGTSGPPPMYVRDMAHYVEAIRILSVRHYLTCWQLMQLLQLLPPSATDERVETVTAFWARVTDRDGHWVDVMRTLTNEQQVRAGQRLGYMNVYSETRPAMHYRLRMYKEDEHELAWQLYNKSLDSPLPCWKNLTIDDQPKRVNQGVNMWTVLRGNAADGTTPQTTLEFDFVWPDEDAQRSLAVQQIQRAWRLFKNPRSGGAAVVPAARTGAVQQPRFVAFNKKKKTTATSKMNDPAALKKS
ncbi:hypothetical protein VaNZ11_010475 [Volvox africanus]|uniref:DUF4476 domain-containing protein n=1 Tax=Volvox africanus TaxID=51714 RepID=A0ABQ5SAE7_9CHLO|nr:hypothetical protein VaNZ11_010475 [Volvox africanus]